MDLKFLAKLGKLALQGLGKIKGAGPALSATGFGIPSGILDTIGKIRSAVEQAEIFGQALKVPGAQKAEAVAPVVAQIILNSSAFAGHKVANPVLFMDGCKQIGAGMADVLNSLHEDGVTTDDVVQAPTDAPPTQ